MCLDYRHFYKDLNRIARFRPPRMAQLTKAAARHPLHMRELLSDGFVSAVQSSQNTPPAQSRGAQLR